MAKFYRSWCSRFFLQDQLQYSSSCDMTEDIAFIQSWVLEPFICPLTLLRWSIEANPGPDNGSMEEESATKCYPRSFYRYSTPILRSGVSISWSQILYRYPTISPVSSSGECVGINNFAETPVYRVYRYRWGCESFSDQEAGAFSNEASSSLKGWKANFVDTVLSYPRLLHILADRLCWRDHRLWQISFRQIWEIVMTPILGVTR